MDLCEFEACLVYRVSSGQGGLHRETVSQKQITHTHIYTKVYKPDNILIFLYIYIYTRTYTRFLKCIYARKSYTSIQNTTILHIRCNTF